MSRSVTFADIGARVVRGRDWRWADQDKNGKGTITKVEMIGWVTVRWDHEGTTGDGHLNYRIGNEGKYDLYYYEPQEFKIGDKVRLTNPELDIWANKLIKDNIYTVSSLGGQTIKVEECRTRLNYKNECFTLTSDYDTPTSTLSQEELDMMAKVMAGKTIRPAGGKSKRAAVSPDPYFEGYNKQKPETFKSDKNERDNTNPVQVRRPVSTIERPKRRSSEGFCGRGSSPRLRCDNPGN